MDDASPVAATPTSDRPLRRVRVLGLVVVIAGCIMSVAGLLTWFVVQDQLSDEHITVSDDADNFAGDPVEGPFTAYAEADAIEGHALEASGGKTYAQLAQDDPTRDTVMTASFLRSSLFTSVVAFGVAAMAFALGLVLVVIGLALVSLATPPAAHRA
ncbi:MAG: aromatic ring-opening dioxygenase LigA [Acidimicrobiales bacterium]